MSKPTSIERPYSRLRPLMPKAGSREERMQAFVDVLWDALHSTGVSWIGFYITDDGASGGQQLQGGQMILACRRDKPACSPIGMHGACGKCFLSQRPLVVTDVAHLGAGYIACDPRDKAEVVVPVFGQDGAAWGVLDVDSYDVGAFTTEDALQLNELLRAAGLTQARFETSQAEVV